MNGSGILLIEDDTVVSRALEAFLSKRGFEITTAHTGREAIAMIEAEVKPSALIVDIHLPDISGLVLIPKLRQMVGEMTPIIVLSGDVSMATINSLSHVGATYFFSKPVNPGMLLERLEGLLVRPGPVQESIPPHVS